MILKKYIAEIKNRGFLVGISVFFYITVCYCYKEVLLFLLIQPDNIAKILLNSNCFYFIFTNVTEIFSVYIQLTFFLTFQFFLVCLTYHFFIFISFALFKIEYFYFKLFFQVFFLVWIVSVFIGNYLIIPLTWNFFFSFQQVISNKFMNLHFEAKLNEYLNFYIISYYICVSYFQIFTILLFFFYSIKSNLVIIKKFRKIYYYFFFIFSTAITPPDIFSQIIISFILIFIFEILIFSYLINIELIR